MSDTNDPNLRAFLEAKTRLDAVRASGKTRNMPNPDHYLTAPGLNDLVLPTEQARLIDESTESAATESAKLNDT